MGITVSGSKPRANRRDKIIQRQISGKAIALQRRASMTTTTQEYHPRAVQVLGKAGSSSGYVIRDFLHRSDIPYEWVELMSGWNSTLTRRHTLRRVFFRIE
jgi:hypothetical protein